MKKCDEIKIRIPEYYYDELDAADREEIAAHLKSCPSCSREYEGTVKLLKELKAVKRPVPADAERYLGEIKEKMSGRKRNIFKVLRVPAAVSIFALLVIGLFSIREEKLSDTDLIYMMSTSNEINDEVIKDLDMEVLSEMLELEAGE